MDYMDGMDRAYVLTPIRRYADRSMRILGTAFLQAFKHCG
jgi:hypothetical protein